jgi:exonuclease SbcD
VRTRFLHLADVHLGTYHWGSQERARDYGRGLTWAAQYAADSRSAPGAAVQLVLIAGDLFDKAGIDAATHDDAYNALRILRAAKIPVVVTEGNHDRPKDREQKSWLESFADRDMLIYLDAQFSTVEGADGERDLTCALPPFDWRAKAGAYLDLDGLRVVGMQYVGHSLRRALDAVAPALDALPSGPDRTLLMLHGGVAGVIPDYKAEVTRDQLAILESRLDYLALGHIHKRFTNRDLDDPLGRRPEVREWAFNPGSLSVWRRDEVAWGAHGFYDVTLDPSFPDGKHVDFVAVPDRPIAVLNLNVGEFGSPSDLLAGALQAMRQRRDELPAAERPLAFLVLTGRLRFDRRELDFGELDLLLRETFNPVARDVADRTTMTPERVDMPADEERPLDRAALEREVFRQLWLADARDEPYADALAELTQQVKGDVLAELPAQDVADHLLAEYRKLSQGA